MVKEQVEKKVSDDPYNRRRGATGKIVISYNDNEPSYSLDDIGGIHMGLIMKDLNRLHLAILGHARDLRVIDSENRAVSKPSKYNW